MVLQNETSTNSNDNDNDGSSETSEPSLVDKAMNFLTSTMGVGVMVAAAAVIAWVMM